MLQDGHIEHDSQKSQDTEYYEIFHALCQCLTGVLVLGVSKDKRLICISERLGKQRQQHGNLAACTVNTQLRLTPELVCNNMCESNLVKHLVQDSYQTQQQYRPCVSQHAASQLFVKSVSDALNFLDETERYAERAQQIDKEYQANAIVILNI